jgi:hypothetical protein
MSWITSLRAYLAGLLGTSHTPSRAEGISTALQSPQCRFPLADDTSDTLTLPDGRKLGYAQYGSRTGKPIFYMHGLPGSRIEAARLDGIGREFGAYIIALDRPGYGLSSPDPGRTLLGFPKDLEALANHLGINSFAILVCRFP